MQQNPMIKEYLDIAFRRKWWIFVPALVGVLFSLALFFWFPKYYQANTRVKIRPQTISRSLLQPIVEIESTELVTAINAEITSEKYVQEVEDALRLVGMPGGPQSLSQLARMLNRSIDLDPNTRNGYFDLKVTWNDPRVAASVANELAAIYMRRNKEIRERMAQDTLGKITSQREEIERELHDVRARIQRFRSVNKFQLESYQGVNQETVQANRTEIERVDQQLRDLEDKLRDFEIQLQNPIASTSSVAAVDPRLAELRNLRQEREALRTRYTASHPNIVEMDERIEQLEAELGTSNATGSPSSESPQVAMLRKESARVQREIDVLQKKRDELLQENDSIQARLQRTPDKQIELDSLQHREAALSAEYLDIRRKELQGTEGAAVEESGQGERFEILNRARPPKEPFWPDLRLFLLMGLAIGGGLGVGMVLLLEVFDQSFKSEEQLAASIDLPILAVIPDLDKVTDRAARSKARKAKLRRAG